MRTKTTILVALLAGLHLVLLSAGFFAPYDPTTQNRELPYAPPTRLHFKGSSGFHLRPFVYAWRSVLDGDQPDSYKEDRGDEDEARQEEGPYQEACPESTQTEQGRPPGGYLWRRPHHRAHCERVDSAAHVLVGPAAVTMYAYARIFTSLRPERLGEYSRSDRSTAGGWPAVVAGPRIHGSADRNDVQGRLLAPVGMGLHERYGLVKRLSDRHPPAGAGHHPRRCHSRK